MHVLARVQSPQNLPDHSLATSLPQAVFRHVAVVQDAGLGRRLISWALQDCSAASFTSRVFSEATAAAHARPRGASGADVCCSFAHYYTALAGLLSRQPGLGQVTDLSSLFSGLPCAASVCTIIIRPHVWSCTLSMSDVPPAAQTIPDATSSTPAARRPWPCQPLLPLCRRPLTLILAARWTRTAQPHLLLVRGVQKSSSAVHQGQALGQVQL